MANNRVDEVTISELPGHSRESIASRYTHLIWDRKVDAGKAMEKICLLCFSQANICGNEVNR